MAKSLHRHYTKDKGINIERDGSPGGCRKRAEVVWSWQEPVYRSRCEQRKSQ